MRLEDEIAELPLGADDFAPCCHAGFEADRNVMPRGLDHIVHAVHDLDAAAAFYARAGFTVGARNIHPWGTHNRIVQLPGFFIELLSVAEPDKIVPHIARSFSFGAFQRDFLAAGQGLSMLLMQSADAQADARAFAAAGFGDFDAFDFAREGRRPDGSVVEAGVLAGVCASIRPRRAPASAPASTIIRKISGTRIFSATPMARPRRRR